MSNRRPEHHPRPPPPLLTRERGLHRRGHPTRSRAMGARQVSPPRLPRSHANRTHAHGTNPPPLQLPLPFACKGGEAQELGAAGDRTCNAGWRRGRHAHRPFPLLTGDPARNARGGATAPSPGLRAEATRKRGARKNGRAPHTLCTPPPFARGQRVNGGACSNLEQRPLSRVGARGQRANWNAQKRPPSPGACSASARRPPLPRFTRQGKMRTGGSADPRSPAASPQGRTRMGGHAEATPPPPLSPGSRARVKRKNAHGWRCGTPPPAPRVRAQGRTRTGGHAEVTPPFPRVRAPGRNATRKPPPPLYALWGRAGRA
ncbi:hypothetical protein EDB83DRAFT_2537828 [Lactarius deliciosus]|nr:hypothetical protein EDB83DRAFT_2537828 [Lactarius deliciosus]